jgi:hypothetical protein
MGFVASGGYNGGYVLTATDGTLVHHANVDDKTLEKVAELLGIPKAKRKQLISKTTSIQIYRGAKEK